MITTYRNSLDSEAMNAALEAFEMAWAAITAVPGAYDTNLARDLLSKRIIKAAMESDERNPERLKAYALESLTLSRAAAPVVPGALAV